jgi:hypothetical protein
MSPTPPISVVVVSFGGRACLPHCLDALARQEDVEGYEVLIPCDDRIPDVDALERQYPRFRFVRLAGIHTYAELRTIGIRHGTAPLVAITEAQCTPNSDWLARIVRAHRSSDAAVIGGAVDKHQGSALSWAMYLSDYNRYMPPLAAGPATYLTDCNVSYKRPVLDAIPDVWTEEFHETSVHWTLQSQGKSLRLEPDVVVNHGRVLGIGEALADRYAFARLFASTRVAATSATKRWIYAATSCLLPAVFTLRAFRSVIAKKRNVGQFFRALPALLLITTVWGFGEFCGYVTGRAAKSLTPQDKRHATATSATATSAAEAGAAA